MIKIWLNLGSGCLKFLMSKLGGFCARLFVCYHLKQWEYLSQVCKDISLGSNKSKKDSNDQESIQSSTKPVPGYQMGK